jgi:holo-[acyl-carrier protein] synthase
MNDGLLVGVDMASVSEVERSLARRGERYLKSLFTDREIESCEGTPATAARALAARLAAKDAVAKLLCPEGGRPERRAIEIVGGERGWCSVRLAGMADRIAAERQLDDIAVNLCEGETLAVSVAVARKAPEESLARGALATAP